MSEKKVGNIVKEGAVEPLKRMIKNLAIFKGVSVNGEVYIAEGNEDVLTLIAGNNINIEATDDGIKFDIADNGTQENCLEVSNGKLCIKYTKEG